MSLYSVINNLNLLKLNNTSTSTSTNVNDINDIDDINNITPFSVKSGTPNYLVFSSYLFIKSFACINKYLK